MELKRNDIVKIITLIKVNYDNAYPDGNGESTKSLVEFWFKCLSKYPREIVFEATENTIKHCQYTPKLANIIEEIDKILISRAPSIDMLWDELNAILAKVFDVSRYRSYEQYSQWTESELNKLYEGLNPELKLFVPTRSSLIQLSEVSGDSLQYERARFFKNMPELRKSYYENLGNEQICSLLGIESGAGKIEDAENIKKLPDKK